MISEYFTENRIAIYALIILIVSIGLSIRQCYFEDRFHKLHIDPRVDYFLVRSRDDKSLEFYIKNKSPIPVVSVSVSYKFYVFIGKNKKYHIASGSASSILDSNGQNWIFKQKIEPNESVGKKEYQILSQLKFYETKTDTTIASIFEITYYRESDMKQFNNKAIFFLDGEKIYSYKNALDQKHLKEPIEQLPAFELKSLNIRKDTDLQRSGSRLFQKAD